VLEKSTVVRELLQPVNDPATWFCVHAEREFLRLLGGGCEMPIGVRARLSQPLRRAGVDNIPDSGDTESLIGEQALLEAIVFEENDIVRTGSVSGNFASAELAAQTLFRKIYGD
jgi:porphobilinogen deaminase